MKTYAGIGSRQTPKHILQVMEKLGQYFSSDYILRSGGAVGADSAFERGCNGLKEIYLPWPMFNDNRSELYSIPKKAFEVAEEFHPYWHKLKPAVKKLMARNVQIILGRNVDKKADFVICYTCDGEMSGGTGMAMRVASYYDIPVYNLFYTAPDVIMETINGNNKTKE